MSRFKGQHTSEPAFPSPLRPPALIWTISDHCAPARELAIVLRTSTSPGRLAGHRLKRPLVAEVGTKVKTTANLITIDTCLCTYRHA